MSAVPENTKPDAWAGFNQWNRRDRQMSRAWVNKLCEWIGECGLVTPDSRVLDFGCGYFDAGFLLASKAARMDGYDPFSPHIREVEAEARALPNVRLFTRPEDLPRRAYDLLIVNSVVQYMNSPDEFRATLALMKECLRPGPDGLVLFSDLMPRAYAAGLDALEVLAYAFRTGLARPMLANVLKAALYTRRRAYLRMDFEELRAAAEGLGFAAQRLSRNLTPSRRRYSCLLKSRASAPGASG